MEGNRTRVPTYPTKKCLCCGIEIAHNSEGPKKYSKRLTCGDRKCVGFIRKSGVDKRYDSVGRPTEFTTFPKYVDFSKHDVADTEQGVRFYGHRSNTYIPTKTAMKDL